MLERSGSWYLKQPTAWRSEEIREIRGILEEVKLCQSLKGGVEVKAMVPHSSTLAWKIPWAEEPGGLQSMGSQLRDFTFTSHFHALEKEMATHSSVRAWRILGTGEPGGLLSMGSYRVRHN